MEYEVYSMSLPYILKRHHEDNREQGLDPDS